MPLYRFWDRDMSNLSYMRHSYTCIGLDRGLHKLKVAKELSCELSLGPRVHYEDHCIDTNIKNILNFLSL